MKLVEKGERSHKRRAIDVDKCGLLDLKKENLIVIIWDLISLLKKKGKKRTKITIVGLT